MIAQAIDFAKEQNDKDLWEDLLTYSETKPRFIRGLLENVGAEIDPIRIVRRIKNGLEIPGLKTALIKVLQDFNLQVSLMEGCKTILDSDCRKLALALHDGQTNGFLWTGASSLSRTSLRTTLTTLPCRRDARQSQRGTHLPTSQRRPTAHHTAFRREC